MTPLRPLATAAALLTLGLWAASPAAASPCIAPAEFVKPDAGPRQPLTRPFVVGGLAVTAVHRRDGSPWLELAVDSEATARRALGAQGGEVRREGEVVLLSCTGLAPDAPARRVATLAAPLW